MLKTKMKTFHRLAIIMLLFSIMLQTVEPVYATTGTTSKTKAANKAIEELNKIGVNITKSNISGLDKTMTEIQAFNLLADLRGIKLDTSTTYSNKTITISAYLTEVLRLLGYSITDKGRTLDVNQYTSPINQAVKIGLLKKNEYTTKSKLLKADAIILFRRALELNRVSDQQSLKYMVTGNTKYWFNTSGKGNDWRVAGVFYEEFNPDCERGELVTIERDDSYEANIQNLNSMIFWTHSLAYDRTEKPSGLWQDGRRPYNMVNPKCLAEISHSPGTYKVKINSWRNSYDSGFVGNSHYNSILATFYFFTGDQKISYALWSWLDGEVIHGYKSPKNFGFKEINIKGKSGTIEMNGVKIKFVRTDKYNEYSFE